MLNQKTKFHFVKNLRKLSCSLFKFNKFNISSSKLKAQINDDKEVNTGALTSTLNEQIKLAESNYQAPDQNEKESFLSANKWVLFDKDNTNYLELKKSQGEFDISVRFSSQSPEPMDEQKDPTDPERFVDFYITLTKNNKTEGLFIEAVTIDSTVNINQIHFSNNVGEYAKNYLSAKIIDSYTGPEFRTLDEKLQQEMLDLLTELGINDDLGSLIEVLSVDKDQKLYIHWMEKVKNVLI